MAPELKLVGFFCEILTDIDFIAEPDRKSVV